MKELSKFKMDIYSKKGTKVKYTGRNGYTFDKEHADKYLKVDEVYTVDHTDVDRYRTDVYLKEVPNQSFNSVHFVQTDEDESEDSEEIS